MSWVWVPDRNQCMCYYKQRDYFWVHNNQNTSRVSESENTGFCMIYWEECTCKHCGRVFEYAE